MKVIVLILLGLVMLVGLGLTSNAPPTNPQTRYTVIAQGQEFRVNTLTRGDDTITFRDYYERVRGRWTVGTDEITVDGYLLRERLMWVQ